jgi:hypothetical protein
MYEQMNTVRSRIQTGSGFFCSSDVKEIPNAIPLSAQAMRVDRFPEFLIIASTMRCTGLLVLIAVLGAICACKGTSSFSPSSGLFPGSSSNAHLSPQKAQVAVNQALSLASHKFRFVKGFGARVEGVQENAQANSATADISFQSVSFRCPLPSFMAFQQHWISGVANFKHYTDGRWVLTSIDPTQKTDNMDCNAGWQGSVPVS